MPSDAISSLHIHNVLEIGLCHRGDGVFLVEDKVMPFRAGSVSVIGQREFHLARSSPGTTSHWSFHHVDPVALLGATHDLDVGSATLIGGPQFPNVVTPERHPDLCSLVRDLDAETWSHAPGRRAAIAGLLQVLLTRLQRLVPPGHPAEAPLERPEAVRRVAPALAYIAGHYDDELNVRDLARVCGLSLTHFRRLFTRALRQSPTEYASRFRLRKAAALLGSTRESVLEVALACGFSGASTFGRQFKGLYGKSPRAWRRECSALDRAPDSGPRIRTIRSASHDLDSDLQPFD